MKLACIVVEDQPPAQRVLTRYIADTPHLELLGVYASAVEALPILQGREIDLLFLDLNLPRMGGYELLRALRRPPQTIVTTAYPEHALEGYDLDLIDYLLKPFSFERFLKAVGRASKAAPLLPDPGASVPRGSEHVFARIDGEFRRIDLADLVFVRAEGDYVSLVTTPVRHFHKATLTWWENRLPPDRFVRVHKSYLVNLAHVERIASDEVQTTLGPTPLGRSFRERLHAKLA